MNRISLTSTLLVTTLLVWDGVVLGHILPPLGEVEQQAMNDTFQYALEYNKSNQAADWVNPNTSRSGAVMPVRTFIGIEGLPCREFVTTVTIDDEQQQGYGTACRQATGIWHIVSERPPARVDFVTIQPIQVYQPPAHYYVPPNTYYNPYPIKISFGYLFHGGRVRVGNYYPSGSMWHPRTHWQYKKYCYHHHFRHRHQPHHRDHIQR